jgi:hypothetical protein
MGSTIALFVSVIFCLIRSNPDQTRFQPRFNLAAHLILETQVMGEGVWGRHLPPTSRRSRLRGAWC